MPSFRRDYTTAVKNAIRRTDTYFRQLGPGQLARQGAAPGLLRACEMSLADFIAREPREAHLHLGNVQTWMLAREQPLAPPDAPVRLGRRDLWAARANLARCDFVGLTERMGESLELLSLTMRWPAAGRIEWANRTEGRPPRGDLDARAWRLLWELTALAAR